MPANLYSTQAAGISGICKIFQNNLKKKTGTYLLLPLKMPESRKNFCGFSHIILLQVLESSENFACSKFKLLKLIFVVFLVMTNHYTLLLTK